MKAVKCHHKGCTTLHKSTTGYCAEHASDMDRCKTWGKEPEDEKYNAEDALELKEPKK